MSGVMESVAMSTIKGVTKRLFSLNDEAVEEEAKKIWEEVIVEHEQRITALEEEIRKEGSEPEYPLATQIDQWNYEVFVALATAHSDEKREALKLLAARQIDPRLGSKATRRYWWELLCSLTDIQVAAILRAGDSRLSTESVGVSQAMIAALAELRDSRGFLLRYDGNPKQPAGDFYLTDIGVAFLRAIT